MKVKVSYEVNEFYPNLELRIRIDDCNIGHSMPLEMPVKYIKRFEHDIVKLVNRDFPKGGGKK